MKTFLHPDYWVEIPSGEYKTGLSETKIAEIRRRLHLWADYTSIPQEDRELIEDHLYKYRQRVELVQAGRIHPGEPLNLTSQEHALLRDKLFSTVIKIERRLISQSQKTVHLHRFYIARFPITGMQYPTYPYGNPLSKLPGTLEGTDLREPEPVTSDTLYKYCEELGVRLPSYEEWEVAARGTDSRIYPWGDDWDLEAGHFYYDQPNSLGRRVDAYPRGMSPYGVWFMVGGLPELSKEGRRIGTHAKNSSAENAWFEHMIGFDFRSDWVAYRPVLDEWPAQQLSGFQAGLSIPNAEALQKMGPLADTLLTQYRWDDLDTQTLNLLEPAIVAVREARKAEAQNLLTEILHNDDTLEAAWLLQAVATENLPQQRECVRQALALIPESEVGRKLAKLLAEPARIKW